MAPVPAALHLLYESDLLPQETILEWAEQSEDSKEDSAARKCLDRANNMIEWLRQDDDEEEEDD